MEEHQVMKGRKLTCQEVAASSEKTGSEPGRRCRGVYDRKKSLVGAPSQINISDTKKAKRLKEGRAER